MKNTWFFDKISIYPSGFIVVGNDEVTRLRTTDDPLINRIYFLSNLPEGALDQLRPRRRQRIEEFADRITDEQYQNLLDSYYIEENNKVFGLLNYSLGIPISLTKNRFNFLVSYNYSFPVKLPGETYKLDPVGYTSLTVSYRIPVVW